MTVKYARNRLGITQSVLARLMGMPQPNVARLESGLRSETQKDKATLRLLILLHDFCPDVWQTLLEEIKCEPS